MMKTNDTFASHRGHTTSMALPSCFTYDLNSPV